MALYVLAGPLLNHIARAASDVVLTPTASTDFPVANLCDGRSNLPTYWTSTTEECSAFVDLNMVPDPGFETSTTNWTVEATLAMASSTKYVYAGGYAGELTSSGSSGTAYCDISARPGESLEFGWAMYSPTTSAYASVALQNRHTGNYLTSDGTWQAGFTTVATRTAASWDLASVLFDVESLANVLVEPCTLRVTAGIGAGENAVYFDEMTLTPIVDWCSVHGHNWSGVTPLLQSGASTSLFATRATMTARRDSFYSALSSGVSARYWKLYLATPPLVPYVGEWVLGQVMELGTRPQYGGELELAESQSKIVGPAGKQWIYSRSAGPLRRIKLDFLYDTDADYIEARDEFYRSARGGYHPVIVAPADMDSTVVVLGRIGERMTYIKDHYRMRRASWEVVEDALPAVEWQEATETRAEASLSIADTYAIAYEVSGGIVLGGAASGEAFENVYAPITQDLILGGAATVLRDLVIDTYTAVTQDIHPGGSAATSYADGLMTGLFSYHAMEQASGNLLDSVGSHHLVPFAAPTYQVAGKENYAIEETSGKVVWASSGFPNSGAHSMAVWCKFSGTNSVDCGMLVTVLGSPVCGIGRTGTAFGIFYGFAVQAGTPGRFPDTWYHLVYTFDGATAHKLYVNGILDREHTGSGSAAGDFNVNCTSGATTQVIDEIAWATRVWTQNEITRLFNGGIGNFLPFGRPPFGYAGSGGLHLGGEATVSIFALFTNLAHYWDLDEASGSRADSVAGGFSLAETGNMGSTSGISGDALLGTSSSGNYLSHADDSSLQIGSGGITFGYWLNNPNSATVLAKGDADEYDWEYQIYVDKPAITWTVHFVVVGGTGDTNGDLIDVETGYGYSGSGFRLHFCSYDPADKKARIRSYGGEGQKDGASTALTTTPHQGTSAFIIGRHPADTGRFVSVLDELMVWNRVLESAEMDAIWNGGTGLFYPFST